MPSTYLPTRESELVTWSTSFAQVIAAGATAYGLTDLQSDAYGEAQSAFVAAHQTANDPATRSPANIEAKNAAKSALITLTRQLVKVVQAWPDITDQKRVALGITVPDDEPTPVPVPDTSPRIEITSVDGWMISFQLYDGGSTSRAKPEGVQGAYVYRYVGETPPSDVDAWTMAGSTSKTESKVVIPSSVAPGTKVWLTAAWVNTKLQTGPACTPISRHVGFDELSQAA